MCKLLRLLLTRSVLELQLTIENKLDESIVEFPSGNSDRYIARAIERAISDQILKFKAYTKSLDITTCLIYLVDKLSCSILEEMPSLRVNRILTYSNSKLIENGTTHFQGRNLLDLFMKNKNNSYSQNGLQIFYDYY